MLEQTKDGFAPVPAHHRPDILRDSFPPWNPDFRKMQRGLRAPQKDLGPIVPKFDDAVRCVISLLTHWGSGSELSGGQRRIHEFAGLQLFKKFREIFSHGFDISVEFGADHTDNLFVGGTRLE